MELYEELKEEELSEFEEVNDFLIDKNSFKLSEGFCPECTQRMDKIIENKNLLDGALTFHIIKYKCAKCKKEYLDLNEAQKYDLFLKLEKVGRERALALISEKKAKQIYA